MFNQQPYESSLSPNNTEASFAPYQMDIPSIVKQSLQEEPTYKPISLLQRLFPDEFEKLARQNQLREFSERYEFRRQILNSIGNMICEELKDQCLNHLQRNRVLLSSKTKMILAQEIAKFSLQCQHIVFDYLRAVEQQLPCLESIQDLESKQLLEQQMRENKHLVLAQIQALMREFISSIGQRHSYWN